METANKLSRQASEYESDCIWDKAEERHRQAAEAYRNVSNFRFDPVATLTLTSLANKHTRWAEYCKREHERQLKVSESNLFAPTEQPEDSENPLVEVTLDTAVGNDEKEDREFEEFWRYMQDWLANPTAFTPSSMTPSRKSGGSVAWGVDVGGASRNIMESFYLVGANPDQSASVYGTVAATPRTSSPLNTLNEMDEEIPPQESNNVLQQTMDSESTPKSAHVSSSRHASASRIGIDSNTESANEALRLENQRLQRLLLHMNERIRTLESAAQENTMLKSSIHSFREEFHRHANIGAMPRISKQSPGLRHGALLGSNANIKNDEYVHQLEQQVQMLQLENTKQKMQVTKYKERWERLKESAKRKRQQQELDMQQKQGTSNKQHP
ncbi:hypothetical protein IW140_005919 [Coemansia sp. RSA 1813]|nr:hypothetical protein IW140_005919 [Coemansia sp. RSA 1813]